MATPTIIFEVPEEDCPKWQPVTMKPEDFAQVGKAGGEVARQYAHLRRG